MTIGSSNCNFGTRLRVSDGEVSEVVLHGELDSDTAPEAGSALTEALERGTGDLVVDVSALSFIGASGLGVLSVAGARLAERGRRLRLRGASALMIRLIEITRLDECVWIDGYRDPSP